MSGAMHSPGHLSGQQLLRRRWRDPSAQNEGRESADIRTPSPLVRRMLQNSTHLSSPPLQGGHPSHQIGYFKREALAAPLISRPFVPSWSSAAYIASSAHSVAHPELLKIFVPASATKSIDYILKIDFARTFLVRQSPAMNSKASFLLAARLQPPDHTVLSKPTSFSPRLLTHREASLTSPWHSYS